MIDKMSNDPKRFDWLHFTKIPKTEKDDSVYNQKETLIQLLQKL
jgi:hypothetical protein